MFDADFKDLIVDEEGLDVLYYKKLKNINGTIHQEQPRVRVTKGNTDRNPPPVSSRAGSGSSSSSSPGQRSGGGIGDWNSPSGGGAGGGSSSSRSLVRSRRLDSQSSDVALQSAAFYGGGVGDRNSPAGVGQRLPGQRRNSGVPVQDSVNYGGGVGGEVGDWNSLAGIGERFDGRNGGVALQASINYGGAVGGVLQPPPGYQMPLASTNYGGAVVGGLQPPPGYQMPIASTNYGGAVVGGLQPPPGYQMPVTAPLISAAAVATPAPAPPPPKAPPPPPPAKKAPPPPPPPGKKAPPPPAPPGKKAPPPPPGPKGKGGSLSVKPPAAPPKPEEEEKVMLKPLHWEKLNVNPEHSMVWDKIHKGSFQYNDDTMEALFGFVPANRKSGLEDNANGKTSEASNSNARVFILDPRKSRNTAIVLKSLGTPRSELIDSLLEGHGLSVETLEKLARTVPTQEEESEILAFDGDSTKLADAESFLYSLLKAVPLAYTRASTMLFKLNYKPEILNVKESLQPMEPACNELRSHGLFLKLLEAILKAGNRLNAGTARGGAKAFNLTTLLKLSDFKSSDGKTTLLSFVVHEVVRNEGRRIVVSRKDAASKDDADSAAQPDDPVGKEEKEKELLQLGLPVVSRLSSEFLNVKKAASMDYDGLQSTLGSLKKRLDETRQLVSKCKSSGGGGGFLKEMEQFLESAEGEMKALQDEHTRVMDLVKKTTEYYQAGSSNKNPLQLFTIVKDFLGMVDRTCAEIARTLQTKKPAAAAGATSGPSSTQQEALRTRVAFPGLKEQILLVNKSKLSDSSDSEDDF